MALPTEAISKASKADKDRKVGTIKNIHKWFAPMPTPAWRALLFAAVVDDPDDEERRAELLKIIEGLVPEKGTAPSEEALKKAKAVLAEQEAELPTVLDPFCGGGSTLVEAQRLGFPTVASDLNPVPTLVTRVETQLVPAVMGKPPVSGDDGGFEGTEVDPMAGLLADVKHYAQRVEAKVKAEIGELYEQAKGGEIVAWIWARTVQCSNPACGFDVPLYSSSWLSKQKGREAWLKPIPEKGRVRFEIGLGLDADVPAATKSVRGGKFTCVACANLMDEKQIRTAGSEGRMSIQLMAIAVDWEAGRHFVAEQESPDVTTAPPMPDDAPDLEFPKKALGFRVQPYGFTKHSDLYTPRQVAALNAFADAVANVPEWVKRDGGGEAQAKAIGSVLAVAVGKLAQSNSSQTRWRIDSRNGAAKAEPGFGQSILPMTWDFAEANPLGSSVGSWGAQVASILGGLKALSRGVSVGLAVQADARSASSLVEPGKALIATDPPYFAQIPYADLSDYFYVWLRRAARDLHPDLFGTMATPKAEELIAEPSRHGNPEEARRYFIDGFTEVFSSLKVSSRADLPMMVVYAHRQEEKSEGGLASSAWDAMLEAILNAGLSVVGAWPLHATNSTRKRGIDSNAVASYIVLICRPRPVDAEAIDRRGFLQALRRELPERIRPLQQSSIPAVDLGQAAIGPGMEIFSRYARITEPDGSAMRVRTALSLIAKALDDLLSEYEVDFDADTRWCIKWFEENQWETADFGEADKLANRYNTSVRGLSHAGVAKSTAGKAALIKPAALPSDHDPAADDRITVWAVAMHLSRLIEGRGVGAGIDAAGEYLAAARARSEIDEDAVKGLAYLLHNVCEQRGWTESQRWFNNLTSSWQDLQAEASAADRQKVKVIEDTMF
ncbi:DUF1156 domain-containing protein [Streptomyces sp. BH106]|uniref:DUF1156 domain-containing protein n=1 Tax=Streptomyces sp. BH106 TaxID=3410409 RepID=UPI003CF1C8E4